MHNHPHNHNHSTANPVKRRAFEFKCPRRRQKTDGTAARHAVAMR
jgi:hypothetical protein